MSKINTQEAEKKALLEKIAHNLRNALQRPVGTLSTTDLTAVRAAVADALNRLVGTRAPLATYDVQVTQIASNSYDIRVQTRDPLLLEALLDSGMIVLSTTPSEE